MIGVVRANASGILAHLPDLVALLREGVDGDAGLGFVAPLDAATAERYWLGVARETSDGARVVLLASRENRLAGSAQLDLCRRPNGLHRAEVQKVMVFERERRQGVGRALMEAIEREARREGRSTLHLDTFEGGVAEALYRSAGWTRTGAIPQFASRAGGRLGTTVIYHKLLLGAGGLGLRAEG
jgi:GNAT superfamily N-acetyltransferase